MRTTLGELLLQVSKNVRTLLTRTFLGEQENKRRIWDVTHVPEGIGLVEKAFSSKKEGNTFKWKGGTSGNLTEPPIRTRINLDQGNCPSDVGTDPGSPRGHGVSASRSDRLPAQSILHPYERLHSEIIADFDVSQFVKNGDSFPPEYVA
jgi:hypothetical protein